MIALLALLSLLASDADQARDIAFTAEYDDSEQRYVLMLPDGFKPEQAHSVIVALHGHGSDRWQFVKDSRDECRAARDAAREHQMLFVSPDYRAKTSWMGPAAEQDLLQILRDLRKQYRIDKVILCGGSMGGAGALTFAAMHPMQINGVVSMNGTANLVEYDQFQAAISSSFGGSKVEKPEEYHKRSAELHAERLTMPIALTTGGRDALVPADSVLRLAKRLRELGAQVQSIHRLEGGHATELKDAKAAFDFVLSKLNIESPKE